MAGICARGRDREGEVSGSPRAEEPEHLRGRVPATEDGRRGSRCRVRSGPQGRHDPARAHQRDGDHRSRRELPDEPLDGLRHDRAQAGRGGLAAGERVQPEPDRGRPGPAGDHRPGREDHRRECGHRGGDRPSSRGADRHGLLGLLHRPGEGPGRLSAGVSRRLRARLRPGASPPRRTPHVGPVQRLGLPGQRGTGDRSLRGGARHHRAQASRGSATRERGQPEQSAGDRAPRELASGRRPRSTHLVR